jgi:DNA invertase Pin-like site-specific DNA recombinase
MPAKIPNEKIIEIRKAIRKGKSRRQLAREMDICLDTICKYSKHITFKKMGKEFKKIIRDEVSSGKTKLLVAEEYGIGYDTVRKITSDINPNILTKDQIKFIRKEVKSGKTKKRVAKETNVSYFMVKKITSDIVTNRVPSHIRLEIKNLYDKGYTKQSIAEKLNVSLLTVENYTTLGLDAYPTYRQVPKKIKDEIRKRVNNGSSKREVSRDFNISYHKVKRFTMDLAGNRYNLKKINQLSRYKIQKIRDEVKNGKTKIQVSREMNIPLHRVYFHTTDIITGHKHDRVLSGKTYELLEKLMKNGYAFPEEKYNFEHYQKLSLKFPNIRRVRMHGSVVYFFQDKTNLACREFLKILPKKITNYHELKKVIDVFDVHMEKEEKDIYIKRRKNRKK